MKKQPELQLNVYGPSITIQLKPDETARLDRILKRFPLVSRTKIARLTFSWALNELDAYPDDKPLPIGFSR